MEHSIPTWDFRSDINSEHGFSDLSKMCAAHYRVYESAYNFIGPYNAKQRNSSLPYVPPERSVLVECIQQRSMNDLTYLGLIGSLIRFCESTRGLRGLPAPHPSVISSIQVPDGAFEFSKNGTFLNMIGSDHRLILRSPFKAVGSIKHIIVRAKLGKLGTPSATNWEVLAFKRSFGYIPDWADTQINPRFVGQL